MANSKLRNRKIVSNRRLASELESGSTTNIRKIANPAGVFNPTGGVLASRKFGAKKDLGKVFMYGQTHKGLLETEEEE
jgi:hypothetical protein